MDTLLINVVITIMDVHKSYHAFKVINYLQISLSRVVQKISKNG